MNITVIGSTGRIGQHVLAEGLRRGHRLTAFTRRPAELRDTSGLAAVVTGDGQDPNALRSAITGADAVIATVGSTGRKGPHPTAGVARALTSTMIELGVRRLAIISAYPIVGTKPRLPMALLRRALADAYADVSKMERIVSGSDLDWNILRLNRLTDKPASGRLRMSTEPFDKPSAHSRADAASALLDAVEGRTTRKTAINLAGALPNTHP
ncbi:NAD(P)-dependent oxidoreductase [Amycolatopsis taiwanensis]|uniref:NAD(P)-dependent oxidoreductase n=1 Tax=Amycolatopsis taiwanensis TaxID=342230 RepID=UPI000483908E|nr:NAD(P)-binding oxidoreductase [Amycolatopsis taiwanensis]